MEPNQHAYLNCAKYLPELLPGPAAFFSLQGVLINCTHPAKTSFLEIIARQCFGAREPKETARTYGVLFSLLTDRDGGPLCYVLIADAAGEEHLLAPVRTLLLTELEEQELHSQISFESNDRLSFLRKVLYSDEGSEDELHELCIRHQLAFASPRCVMLFDLSGEGAEVPLETKKEIFAKVLTTAPGYDFDDLHDFLNPRQTAVLKSVPHDALPSPDGILLEFSRSVIAVMENSYRIHVRVSIGSIYPTIAGLRESWREASFLHDTSDFFDRKNKRVLFITDYISDYLFSFLPESYYKEKFAPLHSALTGRSRLPETIDALSMHNMNLKEAAKELGLHRNTLLQRYAKLCAQTGFDPVKNRQDRISARQFALFRSHKTVIRAGVAIRGNDNIPTILFNKLGEFLEKNSGGQIRLEPFTVELSGDNTLTLRLIREGRLNIGFGDTGMLYPLLGDRVAILNAPFLFDTPEEALYYMNGSFGERLFRPLQDFGLASLAYLGMGWRYFSSKKGVPIRTPKDLAGKSIRIMRNKPLLEEYLRHLGAEPCYVSYDKLPEAVGNSLVDVQENPYQNFYDMHLYRKHKNLLELNMTLDSCVCLASVRFIEQLGPAGQEAFSLSLRETVRWFARNFYELTAAAKEGILREETSIHTASSAEEQLWRTSAKNFLSGSRWDPLYQEFTKSLRQYREETK